MKMKLICLVMALLMVLPFAVACKKDPVTPPVPSNELNIVSGGKSDYVIIRSAKRTENNKLSKACVEFANTIKERTGVEIPVKTDDEAPAEYEIIVGETTREEYTTFSAELTGQNYGIKVIGNKIVVAGKGDAATYNAINCFVNNFVNNIDKQEKKLAVAKDFSALYEGKKESGSITIMGVPVSEYTIVCPKISLASEERIANYLSVCIEKITGAMIRVSSDSNTFENEILIGNTARTTIPEPEGNVFRVSGEGGKLQFRAGSMYAYIELLSYTIDELFADTMPVLNITEDFDYSRDVSNTLKNGAEYAQNRQGEYRILYQNIWGNTDPNNAHIVRHKMTLELCMAYDADVVCFQEFNPKNRNGGNNAFDKLLEANGYAEVVPEKVTDRTKNYTPIFYRVDKFELVECDYLKYPGSNDNGSKSYTWAVLKDKSTGDTFAVLSTHFWYAHTGPADDETRQSNAEAVVDAAKYINETHGDIAIFAGGDFNCGTSAKALGILGENGFSWVADKAEKHDDLKTNHEYPDYSSQYNTFTNPKYPTASSDKAKNSIDHIFVKNIGKTELKLYEVCRDLYSMLTSDHSAMILDFNIKD